MIQQCAQHLPVALGVYPGHGSAIGALCVMHEVPHRLTPTQRQALERLARAASTRLGWPLHLVDHAAHAPHIEQPDGFVDLLAAVLKGESNATVGTREAAG